MPVLGMASCLYPSRCQVLKLYAWEPSFDRRVAQVRMQEIAYLLKIAILYLCTGVCWNIAPFLVSILCCFSCYSPLLANALC